MFDTKAIDNYKSIKAPENLTGRLEALKTEKRLEKQSRKKRLLRPILSSAAACFLAVLVLAAVLQMNPSESTLIYGDIVIGSEPVAIAPQEAQAVFGMKRLSQRGIPLEISAKGESKVSVSDGTLFVYDSENGELISVVTHITVAENTAVRWDISEVETASPKLCIENDKETAVYTLSVGDKGYFICLSDS